MRLLALAAVFAAVLAAAPAATAQWSTDPAAPLTLAARPAGQAQPKVTQDLSLDLYVSWLGGGADGYDVYLQRLNPWTGVPQWASGGIRLADRGYSSTQDYGLDSHGDAFIAFRLDVGGTDQVGVRRVSPDGVSVWGDLVASADPAGVNAPQIAAMPDGSAVVGWTSGDGALRLQRLSPSGAAQWGPDGVAIAPPSGVFFIGGLAGFADGSVVVSGQAQLSFSDRRLWAQKVDASGAPQWGAAPLDVFDGTTGALQFGYFPAPVGDEFSGDVAFAWYAVSGVAGAQSYVQVVRADGTVAFPQNGVEVAVTPGRARVGPSVGWTDPASGAELLVAWTEETPSPGRQFSAVAQRVSLSGQRLWGDSGRTLAPLGDAQISGVQVTSTSLAPAVGWVTGTAPGPMTVTAASLFADLSDVWWTTVLKTSPTSVSRMDAPSGPYRLAAFVWADGNDPSPIQIQHVNYTGDVGVPTSTPAVAGGPDARATLAVAPHPAVGATTLRVTLATPADVRLEVLDALGRRVAVLAEGPLGAGETVLSWDARGVAPGVYLARLTVGEAVTARRVVVAR